MLNGGAGFDTALYGLAGNGVTVNLGLGTASGAVNAGVPVGTPTYTPDSALKDIAGNTIVTSPFSAPATSRF